MPPNQNPEQLARDRIDRQLALAGWVVQDNKATGIITRLTDNRDPKPRAREIFNFPTPAAVAQQLSQPATLRARLQNLPPLNPEGLRACQASLSAQGGPVRRNINTECK